MRGMQIANFLITSPYSSVSRSLQNTSGVWRKNIESFCLMELNIIADNGKYIFPGEKLGQDLINTDRCVMAQNGKIYCWSSFPKLED